ncbi:MAG: hypothetical protein MK066_13025 [Crocinitomicaceae bacterium]|nr:hypothetical protein [Crocinitomicaceae bacterium]
MKPLNYKERRKANGKFVIIFTLMLTLIFGCSLFVLRIADKGVKVLEQKHTTYTRAFRNQALITFRIEEIIDKIYSLKNVNRSINEQKHLQGLISNIRMDLESMINKEETDLEEFTLYSQLLDQVKAIQSTIDLFEQDEESYRYSQKLLERCREKYREISLGEVGNNDDE